MSPLISVIEQIRKEEKKIARKAIKATKDMLKKELVQKEALIFALLEKNVWIESIAKILDISPKQIEKLINNKS